MTAALAAPGRLAGRVVLVTGAARGQGRAHALRCAAAGADLVFADLCATLPTASYPGPAPADLDATVAAVEALDRRAIAHQLDVRDGDGLAAAVAASVAELGRLDGVVANAGIGGFVAWDATTRQDWREMLDVDLTGVWLTCHAALPHLGSGGSVVVTSSTTGVHGFANVAHYTTAKTALVGLVRSLARELGPAGVRVNSVHPSNVDTPMLQHETLYRLFRPDLENPGRDDAAGVMRGNHALRIPWLEPEDVADAVLFLLSDTARAITGAQLQVDAGRTLG